MKHKASFQENETFDLAESIARYSNHIAADITSARKRKAVASEYAAHMEDAVYHEMMCGSSERDAFFRVCENLGEPMKLQELLAGVHNRDPLPSYIKWLLLALMLGTVAALYFLINNTSLRAWIILVLQLTLLGLLIRGVYLLFRTLRAIKRRRETLIKLRRFAKAHDLPLTLFKRGYAGVFRPTEEVGAILDTPDCRYLISLWGTFHAKRHLHLTDVGLYMHSAVFGYGNLYTRVHHFFTPGYYLALPKGLTYFSMVHTQLTDTPKGTHLLPKVDWHTFGAKDKKNVHILLLSPVPFKTSLLLSGRETEALDGDRFLDAYLYSTTGFLSYLNGERIETGGSFLHK